MGNDPQILIFIGSLAAIFAVYWLARWMKLGGKPVLQDDNGVSEAAAEVEDGFIAARISRSRDGKAAMVRDEAGRIMVIKLHGNHFAGRVLDHTAKVREEVDGLIVDPGEARFGTVRLRLVDPAYWADAINRL